MTAPTSAPVLVDTPHALRQLASALGRETEIAVDTEANSMFAYRERLCLLQISTSRRDYLVDPLADLDVGELAPVLADPGVLKVFHGAEFDVLLLKRTRPFEIAGLYDTRVAAASLGVPSPGLAAVLDEYLGVEIDKGHQKSDWGARPLSAGQREYARRDTCFLLELADVLRDRVREAGPPHPEEVAAECRRLETLEPARDVPDPHAWARIKGAAALDGRGRRALAELDAWRHDRARARDVPPFKVLGNDALLTLAQRRPTTMAALRSVESLSPRVLGRIGVALVEVLRGCATMRPLARPPEPEPGPEQRLDPRGQRRLDRVRRARKDEADRRRTDPSLVLPRATMIALAGLRATPKDLDELAATGLLEAWRVRHSGGWILRALAAR